ncbi:MAG: histidine phosphatase family protein [Alphaproteobacteria bacterium]
MTTTRWWWVRHAPVVGHGGRIYGQDDFDCDCSDAATFQALARLLPADPVWVTSNLRRTHQTARAIREHLPRDTQPEPLMEPDLAEQNFGEWQGMTNDELAERRNGQWHRFWLAPAVEAPPGGESFVAVVERVTAVIARLSREHVGRDIVAVTHGGTIRAALAIALDLDPERALAIATENCGLTRIDHIAGEAGSHAPGTEAVWRIAQVNLSPKALALG